MLSGRQKKDLILNTLPLLRYGNIFRLVNESDSEFIFKLRTDPILSRFINKVSNNVADQITWIAEYKKRESKGEDFYIISINPSTGSRQGLNRIYNFSLDEFELGSWLYLPDTDISKSILGDIFVKELAFDILKFNVCRFEVRKSNKSVIRYHNGYSPDLISENEKNYYFKLSKENFNVYKYKYLNICGYGLSK
jgi:hypothetical protein